MHTNVFLIESRTSDASNKNNPKISFSNHLDDLVGNSRFPASAATTNADQERFYQLTLTIVPEIQILSQTKYRKNT